MQSSREITICPLENEKEGMLSKKGKYATLKMHTLLAEGNLGIPMFRIQLLGKDPFSISLIAACINGIQISTASLKSLS